MKKTTRRLTTVFLSLFLAFACLAAVYTTPVTSASSNNKFASVTNYTNTANLTYTATLNQTNILVLLNNEKDKKDSFKDKVLKNAKKQGNDWVKNVFSLAETIQKGNVDWEKFGVEIFKDIIVGFAGIWGLDGYADTILNGLETLLTSGKAPLSEVQVLSDNINQQFNKMSDKLYDIENELSALSDQVTSSVNDVLSGTQSQINNLEAKQILRSFMSSGEGNFSYLEYCNYLYGNNTPYVNSSEAYYNLLLESIVLGADDEQIEYYYNKLFDSLYSNLHAFNQYYYGGVGGLDKSMASYYYDYLFYNPNLVDSGTSAEYQALLFALDLYSTYLYSYEILETCFAYQVTDMYVNALLKGRDDISDTDLYEYADGKSINYSTIQNELTKMQTNLVLAEEQVVKDIAYILQMKDSYIAVDKNGDIHSIGNYGDSFGNVADGQTVYLNVIPDEICSLFDLDIDNFKYYVNDIKYKGSDKGIINCNSFGERFTASVKYGNAEIYSIEFTNIDKTSIKEFSGGSGTTEDPYLISNATQFNMVQEDLNASYQLIADITVTGTRSPIGTEKKPFNGTFDGNGYTISNLAVESVRYDPTNVTMNPTTGMFGTIGVNGVVKNLTLKAMTIDSDYKKDEVIPENDTSYYFIGGIAGINKGVISNCAITNNSGIYVNRMKNIKNSRNVELYVGGITGDNRGAIEYCSTDSLFIDATSYHYYEGEPDGNNKHGLYVAGITATTSNVIKNCRVSENTTLSAYAKSIADSSDRKRPYLTVFVGGIIADDSAVQCISNVYSACNINECKGEIYNKGTYWGSNRYSWDNVSLKEGLYYPTFIPLSSSETADGFEKIFFEREFKEEYYFIWMEYGDITDVFLKKLKTPLIEKKAKANSDALTALNGKIISDYSNSVFTPNDKSDIHVELTNNNCDINAKYLTEYFNKLIDEENKVKNVKFVDKDGKTVDASIVEYYGFNTYHNDKASQSITVKVFFYVNGTLMSDDVTIVVNANELVDWKIEDFIDEDFNIGDSSSDCLDKIFEHGFKLKYFFSNGDIEEYEITAENKNDVLISGFSTSESGKKELEIIHYEQPAVSSSILKFKKSIFIKCPHTDNDFIHISLVPATCKTLGYEICKCQLCGETIHRNYKKGYHNYVVSDGVKATCQTPGYTQQVYCSVCGDIFEASEWIQALPHSYVSSLDSGYESNGLYPADEYHYCINGNHYEAHQFTVSEYIDENGTLVYLHSCSCGYEEHVPDYNVITKELESRPVVMVTNGYVLNVGDEVVVYVQIINNPGFMGATFGIRYDSGLKLISADESSIVPQQLQTRNEVYNGYNFLWATGDGKSITTEDGYLIKLTFKYIDEAKGDQHISVVYGMSNGSEGGFCTLDKNYQMFMTQSGTISVVEHLPGDVTNNGVVDVMDATYIAWSIVGKTDEKGDKIQVNAKYADVNLDGKVDLLDVLAILQSISGRYGTSLLSSDYKLFFNLNGFTCDDADDYVIVQFYDENGNRTKWSENVDFEEYEAFMNRLGYSFVGWYTRMDCTCETDCKHLVKSADVKSTDFIAYDRYQNNQTLYARWERNKIVFDINGCDSKPIEDILYGSNYENNSIITLPELTWSYNVECRAITTDNKIYKYFGKLYKTFLGWEDENGNIIKQIDILQPELGVVKLTAKWSDHIWEAPVFEENGYEILNWYLDKEAKWNPITDASWDEIIKALKENNFQVYSEKEATNYNISYENTKGAINTNGTTYTIEYSNIYLSDISVDGYTFDGWYKGDEKMDVIPNGSIGDIELTAKWSIITYTITYENIKKDAINPNKSEYTVEDEVSLTDLSVDGYVFNGWYKGNNKVTEISKGSIGNIELTAKWETIEYTITYKNTKDAVNINKTTYTIEDSAIILSDISVDGYTFDGWYKGDEKMDVIPNGSIGDIELTAKWQAIEYTITYKNTKGAVNTNETTYTIEYSNITLSNISVDGYTFDGWYEGDEKKEIIPNGSVGDIELTAKWDTIEYTITYKNTKGATISKDKLSYTVEDRGEALPQLSSVEGYAFNGWYTAENGGTKVSSIEKDSIGNKIYYAQWTENAYSIIYHNVVIDESYPINYNIETETFTIPTPQKEGYIFKGWYSDSNLVTPLNTTITQGSVGNINCYAKWEAIVYTISYNLNGGNTSTSNIERYTIESGAISVNNPSKIGYRFVGWTGTDLTAPNKNLVIYNGSTGNRTYTANYETIVYNIIYELNGGTNAETNPSTYTIETDAIRLENPTRTGYNFVCWNEGNIIPNGSTGHKTFTAKWETIEYTISYKNVKGDTNPNKNAYTVEDEFSLTDLSVDGYVFNGWYKGNNKETKISKGSIGNIELTAKWSIITYTITYELNGGTNAETNPSTYTIETDTIRLENPTRTGYSFVCWNEGNIIPNGSTGHKTFTAKWQAIEYTISFNFANGVGTGEYPTSYTIESDNIYINDAPTRSGYEFVGWLGSGFSEPRKTIIITKGSIGNKTYSAQWNPLNYSVTYKYNSSNGVSVTENGKTLKGDFATENILTSVTYHTNNSLGKAKATTYEGYYEFLGWYTSGGTQVTDSNGFPKTNVNGYTDSNGSWCFTSAITLVARYKQKSGFEDYNYVETSYELKNYVTNNPSSKLLLLKDIVSNGNLWNLGTFKGILDGNNKRIIGVSASGGLTTAGYYGMFTALDGATVQNINFTDVNIDCTNECPDIYIGALAGKAISSLIVNVSVDGKVSLKAGWGGMSYSGGLVGHAVSCQFTDCTNNATVIAEKGAAVAGGIVGLSEGTESSKCRYTRCKNTGYIEAHLMVLGGYARAGGIVGYAKDAYSPFHECSNTGELKAWGDAGKCYTGDLYS